MAGAMPAVGIGLGVAASLAVFYSLVRLDWPENYSSARTVIEAGIRRHGFLYLALRVVPVYLAGVLAGTTAARIGAYRELAVAVLVLVHLGSTNARSLTALLVYRMRRGKSAPQHRWLSLVAYELVTCLLVLAAAFAALPTLRVWRPLVPDPRDLVLAIWVGLFAAMLTSLLNRFSRFGRMQADEIVPRLKAEMGAHTWALIEVEANRCACSPELMGAIVLAEVEQRPLWVRRLERLAGGWRRAGTYGVAQVRSNRAISDRESISRLCESFSGYFPEWSSAGYVIRSLLEARVEKHNAGPVFVARIVEFYCHLVPNPMKRGRSLAPDYRSEIEVGSVARRGQEWVIGGTGSLREGELHYRG